VFAALGIYEALGAWRYASLARRSGSWQRLAICVPRQAILQMQCLVAGFVGVIYKVSGDASKVGLLVFLELSSKRIP